MPDLHEPTTSTAPHPNGNLEELQKLLLAAERERLDQIEDRLRNSVVDAASVAKVLPDAIRQRSNTKHDQDLEESLESTFVSTFRRTVNNSRDLIVEAISPVMLPAIRSAIQIALHDMARTLDHSGLSWRGMTWRWEAITTRKTFREVVLSHTVMWRVERVFLFFREDGIHLADVHHPGIPPFEPGREDMVSSMFSAIQVAVQKFVQDEFQASEHASMKEIKWDDDLAVLIEQGPKAVMAAVVRGLPSPSLRPALQDALDSIHVELNEVLQNFRGDKKAFEAARPHLESCLLQEANEFSNETGMASRRLSPVLIAFLMLPVLWFIWWSVASYVERQRWADFLDKASGTSGIHITSITANGKNGKTTVYGLRDPLSDNPQEIAREAGLPHEAIDFQFEPYLSLAPELIERRARINRQRLGQLIQRIEGQQFDFEAGSASLAAESGVVLQELLRTFRESDLLARQSSHRIRVEIHGNSSDEGSVGTHRRLALARAQRILSALNGERFSAIDFLPVADSDEPSAIGEPQGHKSQRARRVLFHVTVIDSGSMGSRP